MSIIKYDKLNNKEWLEREVLSKPLRQIAEEIGCSYGGVSYAIRKFSIVVPQRMKQRISLTRSRSCRIAYQNKFPQGRFGENATNWKGGKRNGGEKGRYTYIYSPGHPNATAEGYVMEHRLVIEKSIGRYLNDGEIVHHKDGDGHNNNICNLELTTRKKHFSDHFDAVKEVKRLRKLLDENSIIY